MRRLAHLPQVGAPDPEKRTSPILEEGEAPQPEWESNASVCYFNDVAYPAGAFVRSGSEVLRCEPSGLWVRCGEWPE
ncbi:MAG: DUF1496 domain-containing protein [Sutterellaceae bacterium]|nr:YnjH family protein [Burkholderiaceae bacterium]MDW8430347.1 DUF1496 domain-containing protein [Sutterellaceae bacterium]